MKRVAVLVVMLSLFAVACGAPAADTPSGTSTLPPTTTTQPPTTTTLVDPDQVLLTIGFEGGFAPIESIYAPLPSYVLFADGRLVSQGPVIAIFPGPILPNLQVTQLTETDMEEILAAVEEVGLPEMTDERDDNLVEDGPVVADAPDTVVLYLDENGEHRFAVYALGINEEPANERVAATQRLVDLVGTKAVEGEQLGPYEIERLHIVISPTFGAESDGLASIVPWPLSTPSSEFEPVFGELRCAVFEDEAAVAEALDALTDAHQLTFWEDDGEAHRVIPRPLFAHEEGCPPVAE